MPIKTLDWLVLCARRRKLRFVSVNLPTQSDATDSDKDDESRLIPISVVEATASQLEFVDGFRPLGPVDLFGRLSEADTQTHRQADKQTHIHICQACKQPDSGRAYKLTLVTIIWDHFGTLRNLLSTSESIVALGSVAAN